MRKALRLIAEAAGAWYADGASQRSAALSFYALLALAPLLIIAVGVAGLVFGRGAAQDALLARVDSSAGSRVADALQTVLTNAHRPDATVAAFLVGGFFLLLGATGALLTLRASLDAIWKVEPAPDEGFAEAVKQGVITRAISIVLVLAFGLALAALLALAVAWTWLAGRLAPSLPAPGLLLRAADLAVSAVALTVLFAAVFRFVSHARPDWRDLWLGAFLTAVLFDLGRLAIGLYLGRAATASLFGAAGSLVALLLFTYYSAMIFLFGAELTQAWARAHGRRLAPPGEPSVAAEPAHKNDPAG